MSIPSSIPGSPVIKNLESMISKAQKEIEYWVENHATAIKDIAALENEVIVLKERIKELQCKLEEKE